MLKFLDYISTTCCHSCESRNPFNNLKDKLVIVSDDDFRDFTTMCTEVVTRTKIDNQTGTVDEGALFTEEYLPPETVMYSLVLFSPVFFKDTNNLKIKTEEDVKKFFTENIPEIIQIGGNASLGKGIVKVYVKNKELSNE